MLSVLSTKGAISLSQGALIRPLSTPIGEYRSLGTLGLSTLVLRSTTTYEIGYKDK